VCVECIEPSRRSAVVQMLQANGRELIELSLVQMHAFAGNMLQLRTRTGESVIAMSEAARKVIEPAQIAVLEKHGQIVAVPIPTIERLGGGSVRCMIAEVHLPRKSERPQKSA
jgi:hypothetical protein